MNKPYLEVTYRQGKAFAAYLYLDRRNGEKVARTDRHGTWLIDFAFDGKPIGIEFTSVGAINLAELNRVLAQSSIPALSQLDLIPLEAA